VTGGRSLRLAALGVLLAAACKTGHARPAREGGEPWESALAATRAELLERCEHWGPIPAGGAQRREYLGELATSARKRLGAAAAPGVRFAASELAAALPPPEPDAKVGPISAGRFQYYDADIARAGRRYRDASPAIWLDVIDTDGAPDLIVPFEVKRVVARRDPRGSYREIAVGGFPAVTTEDAADAAPGLAARSVEVLVGDRVLVAARGDRSSTLDQLTRLASSVSLAALAAAPAASR